MAAPIWVGVAIMKWRFGSAKEKTRRFGSAKEKTRRFGGKLWENERSFKEEISKAI
jgi:hypothetical protein